MAATGVHRTALDISAIDQMILAIMDTQIYMLFRHFLLFYIKQKTIISECQSDCLFMFGPCFCINIPMTLGFENF